MNKRLLILGDVFALLVLTVIGFISHGETDASYLPRAATMFGSYLTGWFSLAPVMGLFAPSPADRPLWRVAVTGFFAGLLAVVLRGLVLQSDVAPVFSLVIGATAALSMTVWRWAAPRILRPR